MFIMSVYLRFSTFATKRRCFHFKRLRFCRFEVVELNLKSEGVSKADGHIDSPAVSLCKVASTLRGFY